MPFQFQCGCGLVMTADESQQGRRAQCPQCQAWLAIPFIQQPTHPQQMPPAGFAMGFPPTTGYPTAAPPYAPPAGMQTQPGPLGFPPPVETAPQHPASIPQTGFANAPQSGPVFGNPMTAPTVNTTPTVPNFPFLGGHALQEPSGELNSLSLDEPQVPGFESSAEDLTSMVRIWHIPCPKGHILETPDDMLDQEVQCPYCETQFTLRHAKSLEYIQQRERELEIRDSIRGDLWLKWAIGIAVVVVLGLLILIMAR